MSTTHKIRACYLRWAMYEEKGGERRLSDTDIDFSVKVDEFIKELERAKALGAADANGWLNMRIVENATPEGKGYSHKLKLVL